MLYSPKGKPGKARMQAALLTIAVGLATLGIGAVSAIFTPSAQAATQNEPHSRIVRYGDLDLANSEGRKALDRRIRRAAKQVCTTYGIPDVLQYGHVRKCAEAAHRKAWAVAQQRINERRLAVRGGE